MTKDIVRFTFRLPRDLLDKYKNEAKGLGIATNALMLQALREWIKKNESA